MMVIVEIFYLTLLVDDDTLSVMAKSKGTTRIDLNADIPEGAPKASRQSKVWKAYRTKKDGGSPLLVTIPKDVSAMTRIVSGDVVNVVGLADGRIVIEKADK